MAAATPSSLLAAQARRLYCEQLQRLMPRVAGTLTIGLLASLTAMNAFSSGQSLALDARAGALVAAAIALWLRVPSWGWWSSARRRRRCSGLQARARAVFASR